MSKPRIHTTLALFFTLTACASSAPFVRSPHYATVTKHLDVGGQVLLYADVEGDLDTGAAQLDAILERASKTYPDLEVAKINTRRILKQLGLDQIVALGLSSSRDGKAFHNRMFLEYGKERRGLLLMTGAAARVLEVPRQAPSDADLVFESDLKIKSLVDLVEDIVKLVANEKGLGPRSPFDELDEKLPGTSLTWRQLIDRLDTRIVGVVRIDEARSFVWPGDHQTRVPGFDVLLALDDVAVLFDAYAGILRNFPPVTSSSDGDMQWLELDLKMTDAPWLRPVFAKNAKTGRVFVATSKRFVEEYLADKSAAGKTLEQAADWQRSTGRFLPKANRLSYVSGALLAKVVRFARSIAKEDKQAQTGIDLALEFLPEPGIPYAAQQVSLPDGLYYTSYATGSHKSTLFPALLAGPAALAGVVAAAATSGLRHYLRASRNADDHALAPGAADEEPGEDAEAPMAPPTASASGRRHRIPLGGPSRGAGQPTVSIVEFCDFRCPICGGVNSTLRQLLERYPNDIRIYFHYNPVVSHVDASLAAQAAMAADAQGKFWEMHDQLFANQKNLKRAELETYARGLGLDMRRFKADLDQATYHQAVGADGALALRMGAWGRPTFFINGRPLKGAQPLAKFTDIVDEEIARAKQLMAAGIPRAKLYAELMASAMEPPPLELYGRPVEDGEAATPKPSKPSSSDAPTGRVYKVPLGRAPARGGQAPKVTIVEFSDFQCPFCERACSTLDELARIYAGDLRLVFKHNPLTIHKRAIPAALAAEAAREQGKFWAMHDKLFENRHRLSDEDLESFAEDIGLDMAKYRSALRADKRLRRRIAADQAEAARFGATGTPSFFVNGRPLQGARSIAAFKTLIDEEIERADALIREGKPRRNLYAELTKHGLARAEAKSNQSGADPNKTYRIDIVGAPARGARNALVTIVMFSDYQCPYCRRVEPTLTKVLKEYGRDVRVVWRDLPLPFHKHAKGAAIAARAAGIQGKYWEMHDKIVGDDAAHGPAKLEEADLHRYAQELGLDMKAFTQATKEESLARAVESDIAVAEKLGTRGTPTFFINGKRMPGAQPFATFKEKIDEELKTARRLVARGTPRARVYDVIMQTAASGVEKTQ